MKRLHILHTEASQGWGGQERRILKESLGMVGRGHKVSLAVIEGGQLAAEGRDAGLSVYELPFKNRLKAFCILCSLLRKSSFDLINTHSSIDSWVAGLAARFCGIKIVRTRHISASIRAGLNARILYKGLADAVATTCSDMVLEIRQKAHLPGNLCTCIPTGVDTHQIQVTEEQIKNFKEKFGIRESDWLVGTLCILRSWKGIEVLLKAAQLLKAHPCIRFLVMGGGPCEKQFWDLKENLGLGSSVIFTGHIESPYAALASLNLFTLLSTQNEGISQASLQAAYLEKPLLTTPTGGLKEVCINGITGALVPIKDPQAVSAQIEWFYNHNEAAHEMGKKAKQLVLDHFTFDKTLDQMEHLYRQTGLDFSHTT